MKRDDKRYTQFSLVKEMAETAFVVKNFPYDRVTGYPLDYNRVLLTGEGSSRIFPAKQLRAKALRSGFGQVFITDGATQSKEYMLDNTSVFVASNSGKTAEGVGLLKYMQENNIKASTCAVVAHDNTPIADMCDSKYILGCGNEEAVAATKSVVEQALFYDVLFSAKNNKPFTKGDELSELIDKVLWTELDEDFVRMVADAPMLYFAGRNDGVAEELTLKTNEITRKKSDFLEGTYAVHGIEEVMNPEETLILIEPFVELEEKVKKALADGVGINVVAIASRETMFPTFVIPDAGELNPYLLLVAGWNLLVEAGVRLDINLDKPQRARKIGNEFTG
ncbi:SIS domain-containing protein [Spirochaetia bacterium 38H-sp]|uniref:Glutamine--fructose-6-phosphate aminotransferase [isomerizing] n=1 Tax=Rarispira pelagica TaxID=3141764 RepID=A0ABU9U9H6_9SPIR